MVIDRDKSAFVSRNIYGMNRRSKIKQIGTVCKIIVTLNEQYIEKYRVKG